MALRVIAIVILVVVFAAGSLLYTFSGNGAGEPKTAKAEDSSVKFDLPGSEDAPEAGKPLELNAESIPEVVAEVAGEQIKKDDYVRALQNFKRNMEQAGNPIDQARFEEIKGMMLQNYVNAEVLIRQAGKEKVTAEPAAVEENFATLKKSFPDEAAFKKALEEQGLDETEIKGDIEKNLTIQALINKNVVSHISVTPEQIREYYDLNKLEFERPEEVRAAHILARFEHGATPEQKEAARKKIDGVMEKIKQGADFGLLAGKESEDPGSAQMGGDLGFFGRGRMVPEFEKAAFETEPGQVSDVIESRFGYHIVKVIERRAAGTLTFDDAKESIETKLKRERTRDEIRVYLEKLRKEMNVKTFI